MAVDKVNYGSYNSEHSAINTCIGNIDSELASANKYLQEATNDASGNWASTDIDDWNKIYSDINTKFATLQRLMEASGVSVETTETTENAYSGFGSAGTGN